MYDTELTGLLRWAERVADETARAAGKTAGAADEAAEVAAFLRRALGMVAPADAPNGWPGRRPEGDEWLAVEVWPPHPATYDLKDDWLWIGRPPRGDESLACV
ncbi:hypothetical protein ASC89_22110 [Devosia sp. Root413D1]|uniref:hypothetical protein n=1 Tax=Devosia sp. Root413D1 TaxID=1736531 RepID=UPI0006F617F2|nr:hypothetical protein [Devosia sp. Root413D1]KQW75634.1 hypothetical protein ASC89_22110 [Devosia sp. Root413D1]